MTDHAPAQPAQDHHALPPASDISHFFHDAQGQPISLLANPVAYINAIKAAGMASHLAPTPNAPGETPGAGGNSGPPAAKAPGAALDPTQIKHQINDTTSIGIAAQLAMYSRAMNDNTSKAFIQTLDRIDDPDLRHKVMKQFAAQTGQELNVFIKGCNDWNNNGDNRDKSAALQLISHERDTAEENLAKLSPADRAKKEDEADKIAREIVSATSAHDHSDANQQKIFRDLGGRTPEEIELIRAKVNVHTHGESNLYQKIDDGTHKGDEDEAVAMLAGNRVDSARAALANEDDPKRLREVVTGLKPDELTQLRAAPDKAKLLDRIKNPSDRAEIEQLINNDKAGADAEHLGNLLKPKQEGMKTDEYGALDKVGLDNYDRRKPANVLKEFEAMSGPDVQAAAESWNKSHPGEPSFEKMLETRWGDDNDKTEYNRILAMIHGDKGMNRSLRMQEGMRENDQDEIEAAAAHDKTDAKALASEDADVRKKAEATKAENASFEANNVEADRRARQIYLDFTGQEDQVAVGRSSKDQLTAHYDAEGRKDIGGSWGETVLGKSDAADQIHKDRQQKADDKNRDNRVGAMEMLDDGKLSTETEVHRGKGAKEKAEALEGITSNADLANAQKRYREKYGKDMLPYSGDERKDMNANELMIDNIRLYGVKGERPAQVEYMLQLQQYEKQYSKSLEIDEAGEAGGGTQRWQRQELASMHDMLKDPKFAAYDPKVVVGQLGMISVSDDPNEGMFDKIDNALPMKGEKVEDGLKDGVTKHDFSNIDKGMTEANKAEEGAKKRLADRIVKIFSTIAKIAAALTAQPELIALIDIGEGLIEMGVKWQVMGEAYDPAEDAKMLAFTAAADIALMGFSKAGKLKGAAAAAEHEVLVGEKTAMEIEGAVSGEAKTEALKEGAHVAAGESKALTGAIEEGASAEKALGSEAASSVGSRVEKQAAEAAEGKALHEGESAAAKSAEGEAAKAAEGGVEGVAKEEMSPQALAQQIEKRYGLYGAGAKMAITTVGGGIVQGKSPTDVLKGLVTGGLGLILPGHLSEKVREAMGNDGLAQKILGEIASFGTEFTANTAINVAGGGDPTDVMTDQLIGLGGSRIQRVRGARAAAREEQSQAPHEETTSVASPTETTTTEPVAPPAPELTAFAGVPSEPVAATAPAPAPAPTPIHEQTTLEMPAVNDPTPVHARTTQQMPAVHDATTLQMPAVHEQTTLQMPAVNEPIAAQTTQQMPAVHERTTLQMPAVAEPAPQVVESEAVVEPAKAEQVETKVDEPHQLVDQVDEVTGVNKGAEYEKFREQMKAFYANQEIEGQNVTEVATTRIDPRKDGSYYQIDGKYDARTYTYDNANLTQLSIDVHFAPKAGVRASQVEGIKQNAIEGIDDYYNFDENGRKHTLPNGNRLQVEVNFVDKPGDADLVVALEPPSIDPATNEPKRTVQNNWITNQATPTVAAHELTHQMGALDEYIDPTTVNRDTATAPGVRRDGNIMSNFYTDGLPTEVKQRTIDQIGNDITGAGHQTPTAAAAAPGKSAVAPTPESREPTDIESTSSAAAPVVSEPVVSEPVVSAPPVSEPITAKPIAAKPIAEPPQTRDEANAAQEHPAAPDFDPSKYSKAELDLLLENKVDEVRKGRAGLSNGIRRPMLAGVMDTETGTIFTAGNTAEVAENLHPIMADRLAAHETIFDAYKAMSKEQRELTMSSPTEIDAFLAANKLEPTAGGVATSDMLQAVHDRMWFSEDRIVNSDSYLKLSEDAQARSLEKMWNSSREEIGTHGEFHASNAALLRAQETSRSP